MTGSKLGFLGPSRIDFGSNLVKVVKISEKLKFDVKLWKMLFCEGFDLVWPWSNLRSTKGILVILTKKDILGALVPERVRHIIMDVPAAP